MSSHHLRTLYRFYSFLGTMRGWGGLRRRRRKWEKRRKAIADKLHGRVGKAPLGFVALAAIWCLLAGLFGKRR